MTAAAPLAGHVSPVISRNQLLSDTSSPLQAPYATPISPTFRSRTGQSRSRQNPTGALGGRRPRKEASMIGKRGIRKASTRIRLAVAAAVLVGGGAVGIVAVAANHGGTTAAQSAGYYTHSGQWMSETQAMSAAMNGWNSNSARSLQDIAQMRQMSTFNTMAW